MVEPKRPDQRSPPYQDATRDASAFVPGTADASTEVQMEETPSEAPVHTEATGYDANVDVHMEDDRTMLDFSRMTLAQDVADDNKDLVILKEASAKVREVLYVSWPINLAIKLCPYLPSLNC